MLLYDFTDSVCMGGAFMVTGKTQQTPSPGERQASRDKYLETDCFLAKKNKKTICKVLISNI